MTVLPIVERELRAAARRRGTHWGRVFMAMLAMLVFTWMLVILLPQTRLVPARHGIFLFRGLLVVAALYAVIGGAVATADCLSREKREGTLGLLFLTDLKGLDVVLGKLVASSVNALYALLAVIPVLGLSIQLGGITYQEIGIAAITLLHLTFFSVAVGILVSALSRQERKALFATLFTLFFWCVGPGVLVYILIALGGESRMLKLDEFFFSFLCLSPLYPLVHLLFYGVPGSPFGPLLFWLSVGLAQGTAWLLLLVTARLVPRVWRARESNTGVAQFQQNVEQWVYGQGGRRARLRRRLLAVNPFLWLTQRERGKPYYVWIYFAAVITTWVFGNWQYGEVLFDLKSGVPGLLLIQAFLKIWVISESCTRLGEDRRSGALELLLSTPLNERDIVRGQWLAFRRQFALPIACFAAFEFLMVRHFLPDALALATVGMLLLDLMALGYVGMWLGLKSRSTNRAILGTASLVLVLPWGLISVGLFLLDAFLRWRHPVVEISFTHQFLVWFAVGALVDVGLGWGWARWRLRGSFRAAAAEVPGKSWLALAAPNRCTEGP